MTRKPNKITIAGAGSARTPALIGTLMQRKERFPLSKIIFFDKDLQRFDKIKDYVLLLLKNLSPETEVIITNDMHVAYADTEYVFCQMRVGKNQMRSLDEKVPLKHGLIGQETCGPGGFAYGMRSIRDMTEMVEVVRSYSKDTWILNYTNPAAIVAVAMDYKFPGDKRIINMCDQPYSMMVSFAKILGVNSQDLRAKYFGLNHFGWFTDLYDVNGKNYFEQLYRSIMENGFLPYNAEQRTKSWLDTYQRVAKLMQITDHYIPNTYLEYYFLQEEIVAESDINYTRADEAEQTREKEVWDICAAAVGKEDLEGIEVLTSPVFGAMMMEVAESIAYDLQNEFILMAKNDGLIPNFNPEAVVEVSGKLGKNGVVPDQYPPISTFYKGLMENQYAYERLTTEAYFEKSYSKALQALTLNRTVNTLKKAEAVLNDLRECNKEYWEVE
ncbi:6-phospho-alpha-glucosidase [Clostridiales bacterium COT073_COT-073]|nr:6-phospho-alpha-glucosidase [Clostridiales bacterium COT073_COT-073]